MIDARSVSTPAPGPDDPPPAGPRPLFRADAGWPYLLAGLALCVAIVVVPAQRDLHELRERLAALQHEEAALVARIEAYRGFLGALERGDPVVHRRLAGLHLNVLPAGERPVLLDPHAPAAVTAWLDRSVRPVAHVPAAWPDSALTQLATGRWRLWLLAAGAFCVFVGVALDPGLPRLMRPRRWMSREDDRADSAWRAAARIETAAAPARAAVETSAPDGDGDDEPRDLIDAPALGADARREARVVGLTVGPDDASGGEDALDESRDHHETRDDSDDDEAWDDDGVDDELDAEDEDGWEEAASDDDDEGEDWDETDDEDEDGEDWDEADDAEDDGWEEAASDDDEDDEGEDWDETDDDEDDGWEEAASDEDEDEDWDEADDEAWDDDEDEEGEDEDADDDELEPAA